MKKIVGFTFRVIGNDKKDNMEKEAVVLEENVSYEKNRLDQIEEKRNLDRFLEYVREKSRI